jgi:hypothetical protein
MQSATSSLSIVVDTIVAVRTRRQCWSRLLRSRLGPPVSAGQRMTPAVAIESMASAANWQASPGAPSHPRYLRKDDLVVALGAVATARFPDPGDRQMPPCVALAFRPGGRGKPGIGGDEHAQPLRLARAEPVHQVVQAVIVARSCHVDDLRLGTSRRPDPARAGRLQLTRSAPGAAGVPRRAPARLARPRSAHGPGPWQESVAAAWWTCLPHDRDGRSPPDFPSSGCMALGPRTRRPPFLLTRLGFVRCSRDQLGSGCGTAMRVFERAAR